MKRFGFRKKDLQRYLEHIIEQNSHPAMPNVCKVAPKATLTDLYVPLKASVRDFDAIEESQFDEDFVHWGRTGQWMQAIERESKERTVSLDSLASTEPRLVVLGEVGSGKTTFISHLALSAAYECRSKPSVMPLPLRISIRDLDRHLADSSFMQQPSSQWLPDFLATYFHYWNLGDCLDILLQSLEKENWAWFR